MKVHRIYSEEFKEQAVRLALSSDKTYRQIAEELGICSKTLGLWVKIYQDKEGSPDLAITSSERKELIQLRRDIKRVEMERDILKKAVRIFTKELP